MKAIGGLAVATTSRMQTVDMMESQTDEAAPCTYSDPNAS